MHRSPQPSCALACALALAAFASGCVGPRVAVENQESFDSSNTYSRSYAAISAQACEAGRRALLSQGYVIAVATGEQVRGRKSFQPTPEAHAEVEFTVVCARDGFAGRRTIAFVNAVQENFTVKKSNNSASVGVSPFGSLSLPFTGSDESLVRVASATITSSRFYDRFFALLERYLAGDPGQYFVAPVDEATPPLPAASAPASASASASASAPVPAPAFAPASTPVSASAHAPVSAAAPASASAPAPATATAPPTPAAAASSSPG